MNDSRDVDDEPYEEEYVGEVSHKKRLKWYHWCILILLLYFVAHFLFPFTVFMITYFINSGMN